MFKKHYSPGIPILINQKKSDNKSAFIYLGKKFKNKKNKREVQGALTNVVSVDNE